MAELPDEIIVMMKKRWKEINDEESEAKKNQELKSTEVHVKTATVTDVAIMYGFVQNVGWRKKCIMSG